MLTMLFNGAIVHGHLPDRLVETIIVPIVKDSNQSIPGAPVLSI